MNGRILRGCGRRSHSSPPASQPSRRRVIRLQNGAHAVDAHGLRLACYLSPDLHLMGWCAGAPGCTETDTWSLLQGILHSHDGEIATESRHDTTSPSPHMVISWMSIGRSSHAQAGVDWRPVPCSGRRVRRRIHAQGPRQRNHRGAIALVEHGALDWDCSGGRSTCAGADLPGATDGVFKGTNSTKRRA